MSPTLCEGALDNDRTLQLAMELQQLMCFEDHMVPGISDDMNTFQFMQPVDDVRNRRSQNMTECVPVPSSEHVAEIVGRQGCKIKALRAKTNTYIKTPVRGEEPVFVVTGRKEDVTKAKKEILSAAEHFSQIRASRKIGVMGMSPPGPPVKMPGQVTIQVRVPYRVVGLVVGPKGATIKRIQQNTQTYIVTPSRDKDPIFEVTGLADQVQHARDEIEAHIALRTGGSASGFPDLMHNPLLEESPDLLHALYKTGIGSLLNFLEPGQNYPMTDNMSMLPSNSASSSSGAFSSSGSISSSSSSSGSRLADLGSIWSSSLDRDEGLGDSPSLEGNIWSFQSTRPSPAASTSPTESLGKRASECMVCDREADAGLIPCGHTVYCYECASRLRHGPNAVCPRCNDIFQQVLHLKSS